MSQAGTHPPPEQLEAEPHTFTSLTAWMERVAEIAKAPEAPFRMFRVRGVTYIVKAKYRYPRAFRPRGSRGRRLRHRRVRTSGTRGSPAGSPSGSSDSGSSRGPRGAA